MALVSAQDGSGRVVSAPDADDSETPILHIDMDAFFASVSLLKHPEHVGKPVLIGSLEGRSVVSSANYEARRYGIGAAMPVARAVQLCPAVVVLDGDFEDYRHYSNIVMEIFREFTPIVEPLSIDEAFLDVSGSRRLLGSPSEIGAAIRTRVRDQTGLACTVGIAATKFVAKIASGKGKPDGLLVIPKHRTQEFLRPLPIRALWGVGAKTAESLERQALRTVADIADAPDRLLERTVGKAAAIKLQQLARGIDHRRVEPARPEEKSASHEVTFSQDITDVAVLQRELLGLADRVGARLRRGDLAARTVALKLRYDDFTTISRSRTLGEPSNVGRRLFEVATELFLEAYTPGRPVRLLGVRGEGLVPAESPATAQLGLWDPDEEWRGAESAIDELRAKFGTAAIGPASLLRRARVVPRTPQENLPAHDLPDAPRNT